MIVRGSARSTEKEGACIEKGKEDDKLDNNKKLSNDWPFQWKMILNPDPLKQAT